MRDHYVFENNVVVVIEFNFDDSLRVPYNIDFFLGVTLLDDNTRLRDRVIAGVDTFDQVDGSEWLDIFQGFLQGSKRTIYWIDQGSLSLLGIFKKQISNELRRKRSCPTYISNAFAKLSPPTSLSSHQNLCSWLVSTYPYYPQRLQTFSTSLQLRSYRRKVHIAAAFHAYRFCASSLACSSYFVVSA